MIGPRDVIRESEYTPPFITKCRVECGVKLPSVKDLAACSAGLQKKIMKAKSKAGKARLKDIRTEIEWLIGQL